VAGNVKGKGEEPDVETVWRESAVVVFKEKRGRVRAKGGSSRWGEGSSAKARKKSDRRDAMVPGWRGVPRRQDDSRGGGDNLGRPKGGRVKKNLKDGV